MLAKRLLDGSAGGARRHALRRTVHAGRVLAEIADLDITAGSHDDAALSPAARASASTNCRRACASCTMSPAPASGRAAPTWSAGARWPSRMAATLSRLPPAGTDQPLRVTFDADGGTEIWTRTVRQRRFPLGAIRARRPAARARRAQHVRVRARRVAGRAGARTARRARARRAAAALLHPAVRTFESERDGRYHFEVEARLPLLGMLVRYEGMAGEGGSVRLGRVGQSMTQHDSSSTPLCWVLRSPLDPNLRLHRAQTRATIPRHPRTERLVDAKAVSAMLSRDLR